MVRTRRRATPSAAIAPAFSHAPNETVESDDPSAGSGQAPSASSGLASSASSGQAKSAAKAGVLFTRQSPLVSVETTGPRSMLSAAKRRIKSRSRTQGMWALRTSPSASRFPSGPTWPARRQPRAEPGRCRSQRAISVEDPEARCPRQGGASLRLLPQKVAASIWPCNGHSRRLPRRPSSMCKSRSSTGPSPGRGKVIYGQSKVYRLTIANPGTGDAENVVVQLEPIGNSTAPPTRHPIGTIRAGDSKVVELELTARQTGSVSIRRARRRSRALRPKRLKTCSFAARRWPSASMGQNRATPAPPPPTQSRSRTLAMRRPRRPHGHLPAGGASHLRLVRRTMEARAGESRLVAAAVACRRRYAP